MYQVSYFCPKVHKKKVLLLWQQIYQNPCISARWSCNEFQCSTYSAHRYLHGLGVNILVNAYPVILSCSRMFTPKPSSYLCVEYGEHPSSWLIFTNFYKELSNFRLWHTVAFSVPNNVPSLAL